LEEMFLHKDISASEKINYINIIAENVDEIAGGIDNKYEEFFNCFIDKIDLQNEEVRDKTKNLLEILRFLIYVIYQFEIITKDIEYGDNKALNESAFLIRLKNIIDRDENNYFLNLRLRQILETDIDFELGEFFVTDKDVIPFQISPNQTGAFDEKNNLQISGLGKPVLEEEHLGDYAYIMSKPLREALHTEFGFEVKNISILEQNYFLQFIKSKTVLEIKEIKQFLNQSGDDEDRINRVRSFLSLEHGGQEMGDKILTIGEKFDQETADMIFAKYAELADASDGVEKYIIQQFGNEAVADAREIAEKLLIRGKELLAIVADNADVSEKVLQKIIAKIETIRIDVETFKATFKNMRENGVEMPLEKMKDTRINTLTGKEIVTSQAMVGKMKADIAKNYASYPEEFQKMIQESFDKKVGDLNVNFEIATYKNSAVSQKESERELMAFLTIARQPDGRLYFGSFNANNDIFNGAEIGRALFEEVMKKYTEDKMSIDANCNPEENISKTYIESGFVATDIMDVSGVPSFAITMDKSKKYETQEISSDELANRIGEKTAQIIIRKKEQNDSFSELKEGFALTRYFDYKDGSIVVFESV